MVGILIAAYELQRDYTHVVMMRLLQSVGARCFIFFVVVLCLLASGPSAYVDAQSSSIKETVRRLRVIEIPEKDFSPTEVVPSARPLLKTLKHQLRDFILEVLTSSEDRPIDSDAVRDSLAKALEAEGITLDADYSTYGSLADIRIEKPFPQRDLLVATVTLTLPCGLDTSLYVFERGITGWSLKLTHESNDYEEVNGGQEGLVWAMASTGDADKYVLALAHHSPWCSSTWRSFRIRIFQLDLVRNISNLVWSKNTSVWLDDDPAYSISSEGNGITLRYLGFSEVNPSDMHCFNTRVFRVEEGAVRLLPPSDKSRRWPDKADMYRPCKIN